MLMRLILTVGILSLSVACGDSGQSSIGSVGWRFDYADWTCTSAEQGTVAACDPAPRGCDNAPRDPSGMPITVMPAYDAVDTVRVVAADPDAQFPPFDLSFPCGAGTDGQRIPLTGLFPGIYDLTIQATSSAGRVVYSFEDPAADFSAERNEDFELRAAAGELVFFPLFGATPIGQCPGNVSSVEYRLFARPGGVPETTPSITGSVDCQAGTINQLLIREIPVDPQPGAGTAFIPSTYRIELEARDGTGTTTFCGVNDARAVRPGNNSTRENENLVAASSCP